MIRKKSESGSALIAVLCLIFTAGILTTAALAISKYSTFTIAPYLALQKSMYVNEGAATRIQYLIAAERSMYPNSQPGQVDYEDYDSDRFLADGVVHVMDYYGTPVEFTISDARSGFDLSATGYSSSLEAIASAFDDSDYTDQLETLSAIIGDYMDENDSTSVNGAEDSDYEELGLEPLPRNSNMQFREELLWIPEFKELFSTDKYGRLSDIRLIPPEGSEIPSGTPSLYTASELVLRTYLPTWEDEEIEELVEAIELYHTERTPISDQLDTLAWQLLQQQFSSSESGVYTVTIGPRKTEVSDSIAVADGEEGTLDARILPEERTISGYLTFTFTGFDSGGPTDDTIEYMEWMFH